MCKLQLPGCRTKEWNRNTIISHTLLPANLKKNSVEHWLKENNSLHPIRRSQEETSESSCFYCFSNEVQVSRWLTLHVFDVVWELLSSTAFVCVVLISSRQTCVYTAPRCTAPHPDELLHSSRCPSCLCSHSAPIKMKQWGLVGWG